MDKIYAVSYTMLNPDGRILSDIRWLTASNREEALGTGFCIANDEYPLNRGYMLCGLNAVEIKDYRISIDGIPTIKVTELDDNE